jgi:hypothetical protein
MSVAEGRPAVVALLTDAALRREVEAGFEEEGVPLLLEIAHGERLGLAREAARRSTLGVGIGASDLGFAVVLAAAPGRAYLEAPLERARWLAQSAARIAARRPVARP